MKRNKDLLPEHIPGGEQLTKEDLIPINKELKKMPLKAAAIFLGALCVVGIVTYILTSVIDSAVGNLLAVVIWISYPLISVKLLNITLKRNNEYCQKIGISDENYKIALKNRTDDKCADGKDAKAQLHYRFVCRKCKKQSEWFSEPMTSCTEETLNQKEKQFMFLAKKKRKYFEHKHGWVKYSLERTCPDCKTKQKKCAPTLMPVYIVFLIGFAVLLGASISYMGETDIYGRSWIDRSLADLGVMFLIWIPLFAIGIVRFLLGKKIAAPEYKFEDYE